MLKVYSKPDCKWCEIAKEYLTQYGIGYVNINLKDKKNREARKFLSDLKVKDIPILTLGDYIFSDYSIDNETVFLDSLCEWLVRRGLLND